MFRFDWDPEKAKTNLRRHHVSFEEATTVFADPNARLVHDPDHSENEDRFVLLGMSQRLNVLVVCHCYRESEEVMRIVSARRATRKERNIYREHLK